MLATGAVGALPGVLTHTHAHAHMRAQTKSVYVPLPKKRELVSWRM